MKISKFVQLSSLGFLGLAAVSGPAFAKEAPAPTPVEDARAILIASGTEQTIDVMFTQLVPVMESGFLGQMGQIQGGAELIKQIDASYPGGQAAFAKRFGELMMVSLRAEYPIMVEQAAQQFAAEITPANLATIRAFMESGAGQAMTAAQPKLQQKLSLTGQETGRKAGEKAAMQLMSEAGKYLWIPK